MGNKVNPFAPRLGINKSHLSKWFTKSSSLYRKFVAQDSEIRKILSKRLARAGLGTVIIERPSQESVSIFLEAVKPGFVIGHKGKEIDSLSGYLRKKMGLSFSINVQEIRNPDAHSMCVASKIARQLEARIQCRRAMKAAIASAMRAGAKGIQVVCKGRIARIARSEKKGEGSVPLSTFREVIDSSLVHAQTRSGKIGVRVIISHGPKLTRGASAEAS